MTRYLRAFIRRVGWWLGKPWGLLVSMYAYRWARSELKHVKKRLIREGVETRVEPPSTLFAPRGFRGLHAALSKVSPTCLERALVLQAWMSVGAVGPDVVIGVRKQTSLVQAHAWVEGTDPEPDDWFDPSYSEILRLGPEPGAP